jgi:hypothetical protein
MTGDWALNWDAVAALATAATAVLALALAWRAERHRRQLANEQRRTQAGHVVGWVEVAEDRGSSVLVVNNASAEPVWDLAAQAGWVGQSGTFTKVGNRLSRPTLGAHATLRLVVDTDEMSEGDDEGGVAACQVSFRDAADRTWTRDHHGTLTERRKVD